MREILVKRKTELKEIVRMWERAENGRKEWEWKKWRAAGL